MVGLKTLMKSALVGAVVAVAPLAANALTVEFDDLNNGVGVDFTITDNNGVGSVLIGATTVGTFSLSSFSADSADIPGSSELSAVALSLTGGGGLDLVINVTHTGYGGAAASPQLSGLVFDLNGTRLGSTASGRAYYDNTNAAGVAPLPGSATQIGAAITGSNPGGANPFNWGGQTSATAALVNPFSLTQVYRVGSSTGRTQFDATVIAAVPVPAAGLMLLTALGGLGFARRKRKAA